ncbi:MAG: LysM peptidoglycan-binding domain-containing protein [Spirochaetales bacterium]
MNAQKQKKNPAVAVAIIVIILLLLLGTVLVFLFNKPASAAKPVATAVTATAPKPVAVTPEPVAQAPKMLGVHTVIPRDTLWWISDKWYKDPVLWPAIFEINKALIKDPDLIYSGQKFDIPFLNLPQNKLSTEDNTLLAQGYLEAYRVYKAKAKPGADAYKTVGDKFGAKK